MKLIKAVFRPERESEVIQALEKEGLYAMTKMDVLGRGRQRGVQVGEATYDELAKVLLMIIVEDRDCDRAVESIRKSAYTGHYGDGKVFILPVERVLTIRTGEAKL
ncbi:MAG: P-II family nitrogen regulator [Nitrospirae bacterium]|nr:P-II family nitrogen regulator [Nitrospirota bacterium]